MKTCTRLSTIVLFAAATGLLLVGCASITIPPRTSPDECLVIVKTEILNPDNLPIGREYNLKFSGDYAPSRMGDNSGRYVTVVIKEDNVTTLSISTEVRPNMGGPSGEFPFVHPLPYMHGSIAIADFVLVFKQWKVSENMTMSQVTPRDISQEESETLMEEIKADSRFAMWLSAEQ